MKHIYTLAGLLGCALLLGQAPGGVAGVSLWIKANHAADKGLAFTDYSGNRHSITAAAEAGKPGYSRMNYNEALSFDGAKSFLRMPYVMETLDKVTLFTVYQSYSTNEAALLTSEKSGEKEIFYSTSNLFRYNNEQIGYIDPSKTDSLATFAMYSKFDTPSKRVGEVVGNSAQSVLYLGRDAGSRGWSGFRGNIPEFFIYRKVLTRNEASRVSSYLAIKYAVTMPMSEYLSSKSIPVWKKEDYSEYSRNVAGIARDGYSGLYQKQASSTSEEHRLVIAAGSIAADNISNKSEFPDQTFLIWGNDANPLELDKESFGNQMLKRRWKARFTGGGSPAIPVQVALKVADVIPKIPQDKTLWLIIDRSGKGTMGESMDAYPASSIDTAGTATFSGVEFDKDLNGADVFTFGIGGRLLALPELKQATCSNPSATISITVKGGKAPFTVVLKGSGPDPVSKSVQEPRADFSGLKPDTYSAEVSDSQGYSSSFTFTVDSFDTIDLGLGEPERRLKEGEYLELDASRNIAGAGATYRWTSDNGFASDDPRVRLYAPGRYTASVTTSDGCIRTQTVNIVRAEQTGGIFIYPNPTAAGDPFTIKVVSLQPEDVQVRIFDMAGRLVKSRKDSGNAVYDLRETIDVQGSYIILVDTPSQRKAFKIIIN